MMRLEKKSQLVASRMRDRGGYIPGLGGLRAVAVSGVILYHVYSRIFPGGFLGVDVFFAISGFLITTLLLRERRKHGKVALGSVSLRRHC